MTLPANQARRDKGGDLLPVVGAFIEHPDQVESITVLGDGNINDTFLATIRKRPPIVLQRLNPKVFPDPRCVADNVALVTGHLAAKRRHVSLSSGNIRFPETVETIDQRNWFEDRHGAVWRCLSCIEQTVSQPRLSDARQGVEVGRVLGSFHALVGDFDTELLCEGLPGFHDLQGYRDGYLEALSRHRRPAGPAFSYCRKMVEDRLEEPSLQDLGGTVGATVSVTHGDPKLDNFLFDRSSGEAVSLIDLDTISTGLSAVDLGDCLRSLGNQAGEKGAASEVHFDCRNAALLLEGYTQTVSLSDADRFLIYPGVRMMTYELGLRFFTDYLEGDRYFKVSRHDENLQRAVVQFTLLASIEAQRLAIETAAGSGG